MTQEIEIKLGMAGFARHRIEAALVEQFGVPDVRMLHNRYFDTPDRALWHQRMAVRLREKAGQWWMTLKGKGGQTGGLHKRLEWEWPVNAPKLDAERLLSTGMLTADTIAQLEPVFDTDFERRAWQIRSNRFELEVALDVGKVVAASREVPICELEAELRSGDESALIDWARHVCGAWPVWPMTASKAQRGYELAAGISSEKRVMTSNATREQALAFWSDWCTWHLLGAQTEDEAWIRFSSEGGRYANVLWQTLAPGQSAPGWSRETWTRDLGALSARLLALMVG